MEASSKYYVYIVKTSKNKLYTGITKDIERRLYEHNNTSRGAKYLRGQRPVVLLWQSNAMSKSNALREERRIKKLSRKDKEIVIGTSNNKLQNLIDELRSVVSFWANKETNYVDENKNGTLVSYDVAPEVLLQECAEEIFGILDRYEEQI